MNPFDIIIVTNGAGELSTFVTPTVSEISKKAPDARVIVVFTPCQYATGRELEEAKKIPGVAEVVIPQEYKKWMFRKRSPQGIKFAESGVVLYMGGDLLHAVLIARKLKYRALAYTQKHALWQNDFASFLVPDNMTRDLLEKKGISEDKIKVVGDLMVDSIPLVIDRAGAAARWKVNTSNTIVSFLPGSRPFQTDYMLPFFMNTAKMIAKICPGVHFLMILSPYITDDQIRQSMGDMGTIYTQEDLRFIQSKSGIRFQVIRDNRFEAIALSNLVLTIPGTNTAEIGTIGAPMITVFPLNKPDNIPLEGLADWLCRIPGLGVFIKRLVVNFVNWKTKLFALPNIKAGKEIAPEVRGKISEKEVAAKAIQLLNDPALLLQISLDMKKAKGERGAAGRIADEALASMEGAE